MIQFRKTVTLSASDEQPSASSQQNLSKLSSHWMVAPLPVPVFTTEKESYQEKYRDYHQGKNKDIQNHKQYNQTHPSFLPPEW